MKTEDIELHVADLKARGFDFGLRSAEIIEELLKERKATAKMVTVALLGGLTLNRIEAVIREARESATKVLEEAQAEL